MYNFNKYFNFNGNILYDGIIINNVSKLEYWIFYTLTFYLYPVIIFKKTRIILYWNSKYFINKKIAPYVYPIKKKIDFDDTNLSLNESIRKFWSFAIQFREFEK